MEARTVNNLPPAGTHDDAIYRLLAIELSKKGWIVAVNTPLSDKISRHTLVACDWKVLWDLCERVRRRVDREGAAADAISSDLVEEPLNHVEPGSRGGCEVQMEAGVRFDPALY